MKRYRLTTIIVIIVSLTFVTACSEQKKTAEKALPEKAKVENLATTPADIKKEAQDLTKVTMTYAEEQKQLYTQQVVERLAQYNQKLIEMNRKLSMLNEQAKAGLAAEVDNFNNRKEEVAVKVRELQAASGEAYEDLKDGTDRAIDEMDKAYDQAMKRFDK